MVATPARALALLTLFASGAAAGETPDGGGVDGGIVDDAAGEGPAVRVVRVRDLLRRAIQHYQGSEFDQARSLLQKILGYVGQERSRVAQEAYTYLAFVLVAYGETEAAVGAFERALAINPELSLSAPAPRIATAFAQALELDPLEQTDEEWGA